jgi:putative cell wall-binding protein
VIALATVRIRIAVLAVIAALVVGMVPAVGSGAVTVSTAALSSAQQFTMAPGVSGKLVAWLQQATVASQYEVWVRRGNGTIKRASAADRIISPLQGPAVFGARWVVWSQYAPDGVGGNEYNLMAYDDATDSVTQLTSTAVPQVSPAGNGMTLIWVAQEAGGDVLKTGLMPGLTSVQTVATHAGSVISNTSIYGTQALYDVAPDGSPSLRHLVTADVGVKTESTLAVDDGVSGPFLNSISHAWWAWDQVVGGEYRAFVKNRASGVQFQMPTEIATTGQNPAVSANMVAFSGRSAAVGGLDEVFLYELRSGKHRQVSTGGSTRYVGMYGRRVAYTQGTAGNWAVKLATYNVATDRIGGADRYAVAADAARASYGAAWAGVNYVVIASGDDAASADPLAAAGLCWKYDAPLLLVSAGRMPYATRTALQQIKYANSGARVIVVGGTGSVPASRITELRSIFGAASVERLLATGNRYDMAAKIAERMRTGAGGKTFPADPVALIANGADPDKFFDALALSAVSRASGNPILLVRQNWAPPATKTALTAMHPQGVVVAGGVGTVNASVYTSVGGTARWWGADRYLTAKAIAEGAVANGYSIPSSIAVCSKLPDGMSGGAMVGRDRGVLLVSKGYGLSGGAGDFAADNSTDVWRSTVLGGTGSVFPAVLTQLDGRLNP